MANRKGAEVATPTTPAVPYVANKTSAEVPATQAKSPEVEPTLESKSTAEDVVEVEEQDLKDLTEGQKVPYSRFKEVNEKAKKWQADLEGTREKYEDQIRTLMAQNEVLRSSRAQAQEDDGPVYDLGDPAQKQIKTLESQLKQMQAEIGAFKSTAKEQTLRSAIKEAKAKFPDADETAVLGWAKVQGKTNPHEIEELMEFSQAKINEAAEKKVRAILDAKKQRAKSVQPTASSGFQLKESERPKNIKEANKLLRRFMGS